VLGMGGYRSWTTCKPFQSTMGCFRIVDALLFWLDPKLRFWSDQINSIYLKMYFLPTRSKKGLKESILQRSMRFMIYGNKIGMPQGWLVLMGFGFVWWDFLWIGRLASSCSPPSCYMVSPQRWSDGSQEGDRECWRKLMNMKNMT